MAGSARREFVRFGYAAGGLSLWKQEPTAWVASKPLMAQRTLGGLLPCVKLLQWQFRGALAHVLDGPEHCESEQGQRART
jgi:hypothetical protein